MSGKHVFVFEPEYLNEHREIADTNINAVVCAWQHCNKEFERGQWLFSKPGRSGRYKRYHVKCALKALMITRKELKDYKNIMFFLGIAVWASEIGRHLLAGG